MNDETIGFIGLGSMGAGMAANLARAGHRLVVYDARADAMHALLELGARAGASPADVAGRARRVLLCLPFAPEVRAVLFGDDGVAGAARPGLHVIDTTTLLHSDTLEIDAAARDAGLRYSDCPVSGMPKRAADGTLTVMFGGEREAFDDAKPYLECIGDTVLHCGAIGSGQLMKAVNNVILDINIAAFCEVLPLAVKSGLDIEQVARVVTTGSSRSFASEHFIDKILARRFDGDFPMAAAHKDIVNVQRAALAHAALTPLIDAMAGVYRTAIADGHGDEPKSAMIKLYERVLGVECARERDD